MLFFTHSPNSVCFCRSIGDKSKKVRKKKHCVTSSPSSSPPPSSISIDSKRMSREENDKNHIMNKLASHVVRCEYDMPEGVTVDNESLTDPEDINDPHHRLNIVFDNFITQDNNKLNPSSTPCQRAKKRQVTHKTSSNKSSKLSSKVSTSAKAMRLSVEIFLIRYFQIYNFHMLTLYYTILYYTLRGGTPKRFCCEMIFDSDL
ncbi:unnamed protein product [Trichobilharzia regenti]|nr:unnamed protein product [Trichobilharzia regenti]